jgi:hypothetical protein
MPSNLNPSRPNTREIHTKDDVPLSQIAEKTQNLINYFNDAEKPFVDLFSERVGQQTFLQDIESDAETWEELSEGEYPGTMTDTDDDFYQMTIRTQEYGKALGLTQKFIERSTSDRLMSKIQAVIKAGKETEERAIHDVIFNGISDGSEDLWYDVPDHGAYTFSRDHSHVFDSTQDLFGDTSSHSVLDHIEYAADDLYHHGWNGQKVLLGSLDFKRKLRNELEGHDFHIPMATGLRSTDVRDATINPRGVSVLTSPYLEGDEFYVVNVDEKPVKEYVEREMQVTSPTGGPALEPGQFINSTGTMDFGVAMVNPLGAVHFAGNSTNYTA